MKLLTNYDLYKCKKELKEPKLKELVDLYLKIKKVIDIHENMNKFIELKNDKNWQDQYLNKFANDHANLFDRLLISFRFYYAVYKSYSYDQDLILDNYKKSLNIIYSQEFFLPKDADFSYAQKIKGMKGAKIRNLRQGVISLCKLDILHEMLRDGVDITPTLANHILKRCLEKRATISNDLLTINFSTKGRTMENPSIDNGNLDKICDRYCDKINNRVDNIKKITSSIQVQIRDKYS